MSHRRNDEPRRQCHHRQNSLVRGIHVSVLCQKQRHFYGAQLQPSEPQIHNKVIKEGRCRREQEQPRNRNDRTSTHFGRETGPNWCIAARQPSIRSKPQRMKRDLHEMLQTGETCRSCTRASECTPTHSLSSPQPQHAPASPKQ